MREAYAQLIKALLEDIADGRPILLDEAERYQLDVGNHRIQFEGEDDLLHCSVVRLDGEPIVLEEAHRLVEPFFAPVPKGIVWFKPAEHSVHYYVGHDHFLQAHRKV